MDSLHPLSAAPAGGAHVTLTGFFSIPAAFACHILCVFGSARGQVRRPRLSLPFLSAPITSRNHCLHQLFYLTNCFIFARNQIIIATSTSIVCAVPPVSDDDLIASPQATKSVVAIVPVSLLSSDGFAVTAVGLYFAYARVEIRVPPLSLSRTPSRITFIAVPSPFDSPVAAAQKIASEITAWPAPPPAFMFLAVDSWLALSPPCDVVLFAHDAVAAGWAAARPRVRMLSVADKCNEFGTPLLSAM